MYIWSTRREIWRSDSSAVRRAGAAAGCQGTICGSAAVGFQRRSSMTTTAGSLQIVPQSPPSAPALRAADQGVASALESVLSDNTQRVYTAQWRLFTDWCDEVGLSSLPADPFTVARYLAARANSGASIATMRLAMSAIGKAHEWAKLESPCRDPGVRASSK